MSLGKRLFARLRGTAARAAPDRWHLARADECNEYLYTRTKWLAERDRCAFVIGVAARPDPTPAVVAKLRASGIEVLLVALADLAGRRDFDRPAAAVVCLDLDSRHITAAARACLAHPQLRAIAFEYATATESEYATLRRHDDPRYREIHFHSPLLIDAAEPFRIYEESLQHFDRKCDIRDFMDLFQALRHVAGRQIPGDIAEFGAYQGHSGYLIAQSLKALGSERNVHLFDAFDSFPNEKAGVDQFWSGTHAVDFRQVQAKFSALPNVTLVKGDFAQTLSGLRGPLALAHVDCDSYRAVKQVAEHAYALLSPGGLVVFEDYGHPALLGARLAVEEFLAVRPECFRFFSQFSGVYVVQKPSAGPENRS